LLEFDINRKTSEPRDAATVIVVRDGAEGLEVFCVRRHAKSAFMGGALVFPGGKVDPSDLDPGWETAATAPDGRVREMASEQTSALGLCVAACRETLEEGRILPATPGTAGAELDTIAAELAAGTRFLEILVRRGKRIALGQLVPFARWVTPEAESRRFDARFFLLPLPEGQEGRHDDHETTMSIWARPKDVLDAAAEGRFFLAPPTSRTLELLAGERDVHAALDLARRQSLRPICPQFVPGDGETPPFIALPGDPAHSVRERRIDGPSRYVLRDGRFASEDAAEFGKGFASPDVPGVETSLDERDVATSVDDGGSGT
jgi:8-oxo-dGTP pyrophosphatase MutT (NUDIX family)